MTARDSAGDRAPRVPRSGDGSSSPGSAKPEHGLRSIPGVGKATEGDLRALGIERVEQLAGRNPEELFARLRTFQGGYTDRCNLYVYRCAVYFAEGGRDPELLDWWKWKDAANPPLELLEANHG